MKKVILKINICGMMEGIYSEHIMIYKPFATFKRKMIILKLSDNNKLKLSQLLIKIKENIFYKLFHKKYFSTKDFDYQDVYIKIGDSFYLLNDDKYLVDIFNYLNSDIIELFYFCVIGGASIHCRNYKFVVHPDEEIHKNLPHVHVVKDDMSVRYSLTTLERFPNDKCPREYKRDEKKVIVPGLKKYKEQLLGYWEHYNRGYIPPQLDIEGRQFYRES